MRDHPRAWIHVDVLSAVANEAAAWTPLETGGLLLGYRGDPLTVVIEAVIGAGPNAEHTLTGFRPDAEWQQRELDRAYAASGRTLGYLGDWHTHPGAAAVPSRRDKSTMAVIAGEPAARNRQPVMGIAGPAEPWPLIVYQLRPRFPKTLRPQRMTTRVYQED